MIDQNRASYGEEQIRIAYTCFATASATFVYCHHRRRKPKFFDSIDELSTTDISAYLLKRRFRDLDEIKRQDGPSADARKLGPIHDRIPSGRMGGF